MIGIFVAVCLVVVVVVVVVIEILVVVPELVVIYDVVINILDVVVDANLGAPVLDGVFTCRLTSFQRCFLRKFASFHSKRSFLCPLTSWQFVNLLRSSHAAY